MENKEIFVDIINSIALNDRKDMIRCIDEISGDEYENIASVWELAKESKAELRQRLKQIFNWFLAIEKEVENEKLDK